MIILEIRRGKFSRSSDRCHPANPIRRALETREGRRHLAKRIRQGHLPSTATLAEYEAIILTIVSHPHAFVYVYRYGSADYPTLVAPYKDQMWLAMFNLDGVIETAFPPDKPETYFGSDPRYIPLGLVREENVANSPRPMPVW